MWECPTDRKTHTTVFGTPVVGHWLEWEIANWVHLEESIHWPIAPWANALTMALHLAPHEWKTDHCDYYVCKNMCVWNWPLWLRMWKTDHCDCNHYRHCRFQTIWVWSISTKSVNSSTTYFLKPILLILHY